MSYQLTSTDVIKRIIDGAFIPNDPNNMDRVAYIKWLADGNLPLAIPAKTPAEIQAAQETARTATEQAAIATTPALKSLILMTPTQIDAWALANITDLVSARAALVLLAKIVAVLARNIVE